MFENAFGSPDITQTRISQALAQFVRSINSYESKYDEGFNSNFSNFSLLEEIGMELYFGDRLSCKSCHIAPHFSGPWATNIGLEHQYVDKGLGDYNGVEGDYGKFKVPTLRNIGLTGPYMHDGRFETLEEVIEHYNTGVIKHDNLDIRLRNLYYDVASVIDFNNGDPQVMLDISGSSFSSNLAPIRPNLTEIEKRPWLHFFIH